MGMKWILCICIYPKYQSKTNSKEIKKLFKKGEGGKEWENKTQIPNRPTHVSQNPITHVKTPPPENILLFFLILKVLAKWWIKLKVPGNFKIFPLISAIQKVFFPTGFSNEWNWCDFSYSTFLTKKFSSIIADMNQKDSKIK